MSSSSIRTAPERAPARPALTRGSDWRFERWFAALTVSIPFLGVAVAAALFWQRGVGAMELSILAVSYGLSVVGLGTGYHRLFSHRSFETTTPIRMLFAILGMMSAQGPVFYWVAIHRRHHQFSDQEGDPHSPHHHGDGLVGRVRGLLHAHFGWLFVHENNDWGRWTPDLLRDRALFQINRYYVGWVFLGFALPALAGGLISHSWTGAASGFLWGGLVRMFLAHHTTWAVNSFSHVWGTRPFYSRDESRNNAFLALLTLGDGWHNNHHAFPTSAAHGLEWWQLDISNWLIGGLECVGLAWNVKRPTRQAIQQARVKATTAHEEMETSEAKTAEHRQPISPQENLK